MEKLIYVRYIANDGVAFSTELACRNYEKKFWYFQIDYEPKLGIGYMKTMFVKLNKEIKNPMLYLEDWCVNHIGRPIAFVNNGQSIPNYKITTVDWFGEPTDEKYFAEVKSQEGTFALELIKIG